MRDYDGIMEEYCGDILSGRTLSGTYTRKAVRRHVNDMEASRRGSSPWVFDKEAADRLCAFAESLRPPDLEGRPLTLLPWQVFCLRSLEGWRHRDEPDRKRFRNAYIEVNRKNGKTTGILMPLVLFNFLKYPASESYLVSSRDDLSTKTFNEIAAMIKSDPSLDSVLDCRSLAVTFKDTRDVSRLSFFCDGGKSVDGFRPRFYCVDEYHEYPNDRIVESMKMGMRSKKDAQGVIITTADTNVSVPCYEQNLKSRRILNGVQTQDDFFCIIYALDEGDDYHDQALWQKANPSMPEMLSPSVIQSDLDDAELTPHKIPELKAKTFGIWGGGGEHSWIPVEVWQRNRTVPDWESLEGCDAFGGLDLAQIDDLAAFTLCFRAGGDRIFRHRFYIPEGTLSTRYRKENANFMDWAEKGIVTAVPGDTLDYGFIVRDILADAERYRIRGIGYDRWQSRDVVSAVESARPDIALIEVEQSLKKLSPLTKAYEKLVRDGHLVDPNPVMLWMVNNVTVKPDENGNYKPLKSSKASTQRIDGVVSSIMAYAVSENELFAGPAEKPLDFDTLMEFV